MVGPTTVDEFELRRRLLAERFGRDRLWPAETQQRVRILENLQCARIGW